MLWLIVKNQGTVPLLITHATNRNFRKCNCGPIPPPPAFWPPDAGGKGKNLWHESPFFSPRSFPRGEEKGGGRRKQLSSSIASDDLPLLSFYSLRGIRQYRNNVSKQRFNTIPFSKHIRIFLKALRVGESLPVASSFPLLPPTAY